MSKPLFVKLSSCTINLNKITRYNSTCVYFNLSDDWVELNRKDYELLKKMEQDYPELFLYPERQAAEVK
jgi:hypothetical protein